MTDTLIPDLVGQALSSWGSHDLDDPFPPSRPSGHETPSAAPTDAMRSR
jgi:hypothetical protein